MLWSSPSAVAETGYDFKKGNIHPFWMLSKINTVHNKIHFFSIFSSYLSFFPKNLQVQLYSSLCYPGVAYTPWVCNPFPLLCLEYSRSHILPWQRKRGRIALKSAYIVLVNCSLYIAHCYTLVVVVCGFF